MKYDIIKTDDYLLILGDTFIWEGDEPYFVVEKLQNGRYDVFQIDNINDWNTETQYKILAHYPLNNKPILNVPLLPPFTDEDEYLEECEFEFVNGYKKARQKYKYDEDFVLMIANRIAYKYFELGRNYGGNMAVAGDPLHGVRSELKDYIQVMSEANYPIYFETDIVTKMSINNRGIVTTMGNYIFKLEK